jgi:hypothetical protein
MPCSALLPGTKSSERRPRLSTIVKGSIRAVSGCCRRSLGTITCAYFPGAKAGKALYMSGTLALDSAGNLVGNGDVKEADVAHSRNDQKRPAARSRTLPSIISSSPIWPPTPPATRAAGRRKTMVAY